MSDQQIYLTFTTGCHACGETVQYIDGKRQPHPCPEPPALVIEGCGGGGTLVERVERALDDMRALSNQDGAP